MFRTRRQRRKEQLSVVGFLPFESSYLSKVPRYVPYFKEMVRDRTKKYKRAIREGISKREYTEQIKDMYRAREWYLPVYYKKLRLGRVRADAWAMLRYYQDEWERKYGKYDSPWRKRRVQIRHMDWEQVKRRRETPLQRYDRLRGR